MLTDKIRTHPFTLAAIEAGYKTDRDLESRGITEDSEEVNEYEFYLVRVAYALSHFVGWVEQLEHAVTYLSTFNYSEKARQDGINRANHLLYNVENYLIRLQSAYDRALQLTNNVFHLLIAEENVQHAHIVSNLKVSRTNIPSLLKQLQKSISGKAQDRHALIHRRSHQEKDLDRLQLFYMQDEKSWTSNLDIPFARVSYMRTRLLKRTVTQKKNEFTALNSKLFDKSVALLDGLQVQYDLEVKRLHTQVYR